MLKVLLGLSLVKHQEFTYLASRKKLGRLASQYPRAYKDASIDYGSAMRSLISFVLHAAGVGPATAGVSLEVPFVSLPALPARNFVKRSMAYCE